MVLEHYGVPKFIIIQRVLNVEKVTSLNLISEGGLVGSVETGDSERVLAIDN